MTAAPKKLKRKRPYLEIAGEILEGAIPLASALVHLREKPRMLDWLALGVAGVNALVKGKNVYDRMTTPSSREFFATRDEKGEFIWIECPEPVGRFVYQCIEEVEEHTRAPSQAWQEGPSIIMGRIGEETVGWEQQDGVRNRYNAATETPLVYLVRNRQEETYNEVSRRLWEKVEGNHLLLTPRGFETTQETTGGIYITPDIKKLSERIQKFIKTGEPRAYLLEGPPGTGKTTAIKHVVSAEGFRSLRANPAEMLDNSGSNADNSTKRNTLAVLAVTKPDVLILDDIDHHDGDDLLEILSTCREHVKVVLGSANNKWRLDGATLRTGRFDDHITFHKLPPEVIEVLLGKYKHLADQMEAWPISYITDFVHKANVLGEEVALTEMAETAERLEKIDESISRDADPESSNITNLIIGGSPPRTRKR